MLSITIGSPANNGALPATITGRYDLSPTPPPASDSNARGRAGTPAPPLPVFTVVITNADPHNPVSYALTADPLNGDWTAPVPAGLPDFNGYIIVAVLTYNGNSDSAVVTGVHKP
jgi:hypothetical protein